MSDKDAAIKVTNVSKTFKLPHEQRNSIKSAFVNVFRGKRTYERQQVLKDISFDIKKGDFFGIVGRNGSGKSTLLKLMAEIYTPDKGHIQVNGKLTPFIELGIGFNPELTGRENTFLNGALLGFSRKEMAAMYDEIVEFAELERFMDQKLNNYSSGMQVRLAFSIAIRARSEILLLDEVLAVGDANFQRKCYGYFSQLKKEGRTVVLVTHDMDVVQNYCTKALLLHKGEIVKMGSVKETVQKYTELNISDLEKQTKNQPAQDNLKRFGDGSARITKVWTSSKGKKKTVFRPEDNIEVNIDIKALKALPKPVIGMILQNQQGNVVFASNTVELGQNLKDVSEGAKLQATFTIDNVYTNGKYTVSCAITNHDRTQIFSRLEDACALDVAGWSMGHSLAHPHHTFHIDVN